MSKLRFLSAALALGVSAVSTHAATLDTTTATPDDGFVNFTGVDWHANGSVLISGFGLTAANGIGDTDVFTLQYQGFAGGINGGSPTPNLYVASPGSATGSYELTALATMTETAMCLNAGCSAISLTGSGTWQIFFDISPDANQTLGTGFGVDADSIEIAAGTFDSQLVTFIATGAIPGAGVLGAGGGTLFGTVTDTNNDYINPDLLGTQFASTLNFPGQSAPNFVPAANFLAICGGANTAECFVVQGDGDQAFTSVPEPGTLALIGLGLFGIGLGKRRSAKA